MHKIELNVINCAEGLKSNVPKQFKTQTQMNEHLENERLLLLCESIRNYYKLSDEEWIKRYWHQVCVDIHYTHPNSNSPHFAKIVNDALQEALVEEIERVKRDLEMYQQKLESKSNDNKDILLAERYVSLTNNFIYTTRKRASTQDALRVWVFKERSILQIATMEYAKSITNVWRPLVLNNEILTAYIESNCNLLDFQRFDKLCKFIESVDTCEGQLCSAQKVVGSSSYFDLMLPAFEKQFGDVAQSYLSIVPVSDDQYKDLESRCLELIEYVNNFKKYLSTASFKKGIRLMQINPIELIKEAVPTSFGMAVEYSVTNDTKLSEYVIPFINEGDGIRLLFKEFLKACRKGNDFQDCKEYAMRCAKYTINNISKNRRNFDVTLQRFQNRFPEQFDICKNVFIENTPSFDLVKTVLGSSNDEERSFWGMFIERGTDDFDTGQMVSATLGKCILPSSIGGDGSNVFEKFSLQDLEENSLLLNRAIFSAIGMGSIMRMLAEVKDVPNPDKTVILKLGQWFTDEDPTMVDQLPAEIAPFMNEPIKENTTVLWRLSWTAVDVEYKGKPLRCSYLQFLAINSLLVSSEPLSIDELIPDVEPGDLVNEVIDSMFKKGVIWKVDDKYVLNPQFPENGVKNIIDIPIITI